MGEVVEMMLDGTLCGGCGVFLDSACGYPRICEDCASEFRIAGRTVERNGKFFIDCGMKSVVVANKVICPTCNSLRPRRNTVLCRFRRR